MSKKITALIPGAALALGIACIAKWLETLESSAGLHYLRIEGACYIGIGILFLLYGYYRAVNKSMMSVVLTIASLGTRVALAYLLSATTLGVTGIGLSVPIGWALADAIGIGYYLKTKTA